MLSGYSVCQLYRALKLHFISDYDYFYYNGKLKYSKQQYDSNKHKFVYKKLAFKFKTEEDLIKFFVANFVYNSSSVWVQELTSVECSEYLTKYNKIHQSLKYIFDTDIHKLFSEYEYKSLFICDENNLPLIVKLLLRGDIHIESFIILNRFIKFMSKIDAKLTNNYIWPDLKRKLIKYEPFICYEKEKFKDSLLATMDEFVK